MLTTQLESTSKVPLKLVSTGYVIVIRNYVVCSYQRNLSTTNQIRKRNIYLVFQYFYFKVFPEGSGNSFNIVYFPIILTIFTTN